MTYLGGLSSISTAVFLWQLRDVLSKRVKQKLLVLPRTGLETGIATLLPRSISPRPAQLQHWRGLSGTVDYWQLYLETSYHQPVTSSNDPFKVIAIISPALQMRKLRHRER